MVAIAIAIADAAVPGRWVAGGPPVALGSWPNGDARSGMRA